MKIELYPIPGSPRLKIVPAKKARDWMDPHAYRCLPITAANAYGWDLVLTEEVTFHWNGGKARTDIEIIGDGEHNASSHFGGGTVTFPVGYAWHTEPGIHLMVGPQLNPEKTFFQTISAVIETDTLRYPWFLTIRAMQRGTTILPPGTILGRVYPVRISDVTEATIAEAVEPEEFRLAREQQAVDRTESVKADPKAWLRFYHDQVSHPNVKAAEVEAGEADADILVKNNIYAQPGFLTKEEAKTVADFLYVAPEREQSIDYWKGRTYNFDSSHFSPELYRKLTTKVHEHVSAFYKKDLKAEHPSLVRWSEGMNMRPHSDYARGIFPDRDFAAVIYLTDDYDGGTIFFPTLGIELMPEAGSLVAFPGGPLFHGIRTVTRGDRLTAICWFKDLSKEG